MGFRFQRRVQLGKGLGLNISRSGFSLSQRTRWGTFGTRGVSIRSGIPGLSFRMGRRGGGVLFALLGGILSFVVYGTIAAVRLGALLLWLAAVTMYWTLIGTFQVTRWVVLTAYDLVVYLAARRLPAGDRLPTLDALSIADSTSPTAQTEWSTPSPNLSSSPPSDSSDPMPLLPDETSDPLDDERKLLAKLSEARGPAARRSIVERALRKLPTERRDHFLLRASEVEVQAALAKADGLKGVTSKRRVLTEALAFIRNDIVPDHLQAEQIQRLENALRTLESE